MPKPKNPRSDWPNYFLKHSNSAEARPPALPETHFFCWFAGGGGVRCAQPVTRFMSLFEISLDPL
jgi:hypothetical protein